MSWAEYGVTQLTNQLEESRRENARLRQELTATTTELREAREAYSVAMQFGKELAELAEHLAKRLRHDGIEDAMDMSGWHYD